MKVDNINDASKSDLQAFVIRKYVKYALQMKKSELRQEARPLASEEAS